MRTRTTRGLARPAAVTAGALGGCLLVLAVVGGASTVADQPGDHPADRSPLGAERADVAALPAPVAGAQHRGQTQEQAAGPRAGRPQVIVIRSLGVRAPVVPIAAEGRVLVPPSDPSTVGWWSGGVRPGDDRGTAVLTGHTVSTGGGVFDDLERLRTGAVVTVTTAHGRLSYVVVRSRSYPKQSLGAHAQRVFDQSAPARLVLVTCEDWNGEVYLSNHVVTARPVNRP